MRVQHIAKRPRDIAECVSAYLQDGDIVGVVSMFHPDCHLFFPPDEPPHVGLQRVRKAFEGLISDRPQIISVLISEVVVGDIALLSANWRAVTGEGTTIAEGQSIEVAKRLENGGWGYLIDCPNGLPELTE